MNTRLQTWAKNFYTRLRNSTWRSWLPNIALVIILPFFRLETFCMYEHVNSRWVEWTGIHISLFKYRFDFKWYWKPLP